MTCGVGRRHCHRAADDSQGLGVLAPYPTHPVKAWVGLSRHMEAAPEGTVNP